MWKKESGPTEVSFSENIFMAGFYTKVWITSAYIFFFKDTCFMAKRERDRVKG